MIYLFLKDFAIEDVLSEYDADKDGFISLREFIGDIRGDGKATEAIWHSSLSIFVVNLLITYVLILIILSEDSPSQWEIEETVRFKDLYDQDRDGKLNREEQLRWVAPNSYGASREEVNLIDIHVLQHI